MESGNRTVWIVIAVIVVGALLCCCVVAVGAAVAGLYAFPISQETGVGRVAERTEQSFTVGDAPTLEVDNFAGDVTVRSGGGGEIRVIVTKRAASDSQLDRISVDVSEQADGVRVQTSHPGTSIGGVSVQLEILVPGDARLELDTGAGNVAVDGVQGEVSARSGAGNVRVRGAAGLVDLEVGAGEIDYEGDPQGDCTFTNNVGNVTLRLPEDVNAEVRLTTGVGNVDLGGFDVEGEVGRTEVDGVIGTGEEANIEARTGAGNVVLVRR
jgi:predicted membrane protein